MTYRKAPDDSEPVMLGMLNEDFNRMTIFSCLFLQKTGFNMKCQT